MIRLATVQFQPVYRDVDANTAFIVNAIANTDADVIIFPELSTCGYFFVSRDEVGGVAESVDGPHITAITNAAHAANRVVVCGFAERDGDNLYNSAVIAGPGINTRVYRKTHLFYKETLCFDEGNTGFFVVHLPHLDCNLGVMICYDWRFPESARTLALQGADLIACPSNLVTHIWRMAMPVRAFENKVYLAVANRYGTETNTGEDVSFNGQSAIYSFNGEVLTSANAEETVTLISEIDPSATRNKQFNSINDIFKDRRPESY
ncbi:MAG: carbon-nitrogen hydrolase [Candidatus Kapabacteria bacterium]|nr:carbon-nitrogen hydrolase [Candidatus Kapabacteria bacterium]